jgi:hypothetical protein
MRTWSCRPNSQPDSQVTRTSRYLSNISSSSVWLLSSVMLAAKLVWLQTSVSQVPLEPATTEYGQVC